MDHAQNDGQGASGKETEAAGRAGSDKAGGGGEEADGGFVVVIEQDLARVNPDHRARRSKRQQSSTQLQLAPKSAITGLAPIDS